MDKCSMELQVRFNRAVDKNKDFISPGGYEMIMNGITVHFDFNISYVNIKRDEPEVCLISLEEPDYVSFPQFQVITPDDLNNITEIIECYVYAGEDDETDIEVESIEAISFVIYQKDENVIELPQRVLDEYNERLRKERTERK